MDLHIILVGNPPNTIWFWERVNFIKCVYKSTVITCGFVGSNPLVPRKCVHTSGPMIWLCDELLRRTNYLTKISILNLDFRLLNWWKQLFISIHKFTVKIVKLSLHKNLDKTVWLWDSQFGPTQFARVTSHVFSRFFHFLDIYQFWP